MEVPQANNNADKVINLFISSFQSYQAERMIGWLAAAFMKQPLSKSKVGKLHTADAIATRQACNNPAT
jgi:hypothetical protein